MILSPLAWGRGLKPKLSAYLHVGGVSPLAWGRGLKLCHLSKFLLRYLVAPRVGAWIETNWYSLNISTINKSPLAWGRGLKRYLF